MDDTTPRFEVQIEVPFSRVADLLTCAFEGGSGYWIETVKKRKPVQWNFHSSPELGRKPGDPPSVYLCDYPFNPGGKLIFMINEPFDNAGTTEYTLDFKKVEAGLKTFLKGEGWGKNEDGTPKIVRRHAENFLKDNEDAETGDVFLQICLFGEVIFG